MKQIRTITAALLVLLPFAANAGLITDYSDRTTFTNSVGGSLTVEDFTDTHHFPIASGILNSSSTDSGLQPGDIEEGVTYSTPVGQGNFFFIIDAGGQYTGGFLDSLDNDRDVTIDFDAPVAAFGFDMGSLGGVSTDILISFLNGPDQLFTVQYPSTIAFFGWQSDQVDITSVLVGNTGSTFGFDFDNFTFGGQAAAAVPEPGTLALLGLGLAGIGFAKRK